MPASNNPYLKSIFKNPPTPSSRPIGTNLDPNPYNPAQGPLPLKTSSRLGTYAGTQETMVNHSSLNSSALIAAAMGSSPSPKNRKRPRAPRSSSDVSELNDDDFSPATHRRLSASVGSKKQKGQPKKPKQTKRKSQGDLFIDDGEDEDMDDDVADDVANDFLPTAMIRKKAIPTDDNFLPLVMTRKKMPTTPSSDAVTLYDATSADMLRLKKTPAKPVPQTLVLADEADRMMFTLKNQGKPWADILDKWEEITNTRPAASTLSVRFIKLNENLAANGYANKIHPQFYEIFPQKRYLLDFREKQAERKQQDLYLIQAKNKVDKALETQRWNGISNEMRSLTGAKWTPKALKRRYAKIEDDEFLLGVEKNAVGEIAIHGSPNSPQTHDQVGLDYDETERNLAGLYENESSEHTHPQDNYSEEPTPSKSVARGGLALVDYGSDQE